MSTVATTTGIRHLFHAGMSAPDVQAIAGHASLLTTQMYANTRRDAARRGAAALSEFYAGISKQGHQPVDGAGVPTVSEGVA